jgi:hypothetical protein
MRPGDQIVRDEEFEVERFMALGLDRYEAIKAVEDAIDWHEVETLVKTGHPLTVAIEISR